MRELVEGIHLISSLKEVTIVRILVPYKGQGNPAVSSGLRWEPLEQENVAFVLRLFKDAVASEYTKYKKQEAPSVRYGLAQLRIDDT
jgi:hypothetical protein